MRNGTSRDRIRDEYHYLGIRDRCNVVFQNRALIVVSAIHLLIKQADASRDARSCVSTFDLAELKIKARN
jgi:hypothetical protein